LIYSGNKSFLILCATVIYEFSW